ncbi:MAG: type II toxin-antitoxin system YafQ family toxin [bacterium]
MLEIRETKQFKKQFKRVARSGDFDMRLFHAVLNVLARGESLDEKYRDHQLSGDMKEARECHLKGDLLLVYKIRKEILVLSLVGIGSHSELFD